MALPAELTSSYDERTRLMTWRVAVLALAILVSGGLAPVVRDAVGYWAVGLFVGALIAIARGQFGAAAMRAFGQRTIRVGAYQRFGALSHSIQISSLFYTPTHSLRNCKLKSCL